MYNEQHIIKEKKGNNKDAKFSILIPSWNNLPHLQLCVNSIRKNSAYPHQIIIHINEGADGTFEWVKAQPDLDYSYSRQNIGVCYALNTARTLAETNYILYLNDDMYVCPDWDAHLYREIINTGHELFFFSATAIEPHAQSACSIEKEYGKNIAEFNEKKLLEEYALLPMKDWQGATWPPNIVHINTWDLVGGYSIEFSPGMYSDPDFSMKLWEAGIRLFKGLEKSRVYHFGSISVKRVKKNKGYHTFIAKWGITSSTFTKYYLKRGAVFTGLATAPKLSSLLVIKNALKRLMTIIYNR